MEDQRLDVQRKFSYNCGEIIHERIAKLLKLINKSFSVFAANAVTFCFERCAFWFMSTFTFPLVRRVYYHKSRLNDYLIMHLSKSYPFIQNSRDFSISEISI